MKIAVSACLLGENCKYNGGNNYNEKVMEFIKGHEVIGICPELLGGLPVPRKPAEIADGIVRTKDGASVNFRWSQKNTASLITDAVGYFAYYPTTIIFKLPAVQEYAKDGPSLVPMMAHFLNTYSETFNPKFLFKNVCGVIKLNLTTSQPGVAIQSIVFHSDQPLCGRYRVNQNLQLRFTEPQDLTLTCPDVPICETPKAFYVSVPPQIYDSLTLTIHTSDGRIATWNLQPERPLTVQRAEIATLDVACNDFLN